MTFPTRFSAAGPPIQPDKPQDPKTQQEKDEAARKQAQSDPHKQRTPQ
ncbi:hypothetical protein [Bordetella bronchiseptica]|nr:hypothetical protein [Bordetella bronchiseptica]